MFCVLCSTSLKTDEEANIHEHTTGHLIAARNMWRKFIEHPARNNHTFTEIVKTAHANLKEIDRRLAMLNQKEA